MFRAPLGVTDYRFSAPVDAGIVEVDDEIAAQFEVVEIGGKHPFVVLPPFEGLEVVRRGYRTQLRTGTVEAVDLTITVTANNGDRLRIGPTVFSIRSPERLISAMKGDSGSLVVDAAGGAARGLVFASNEQSGGDHLGVRSHHNHDAARHRDTVHRCSKSAHPPCGPPPVHGQLGGGAESRRARRIAERLR